MHEHMFSRFAKWVSRQCGRASTFIVAILVILVWAATGPMFPASVESKVEQYLNIACRIPAGPRSQSSAAMDCTTASCAGKSRSR